MSKPFDAATKHLFDIDPNGWKRLLGLDITAPLELVNPDVSTVTSAADQVLRVLEEMPWLIHAEFQASRDRRLPLRVHRYNVLLEYKYDCRVYSVVILLRPEADGPELTGHRESRRPDGKLISEFHYDVLRLWQLQPEDILSGGLGTLPLAPLTKVSKRRIPAIVRQVQQRLTAETTPPHARELMESMFVLTGLRYSDDVVNQLFQGVQDMRESSVIQAAIQEGREEGHEEGREEAFLEAVLKAGAERFGPPPKRIQAEIKKLKKPARVFNHLFEVNSWDELLKAK